MGQGPLESLLLSVTQGKTAEVPEDLTLFVRETAETGRQGTACSFPAFTLTAAFSFKTYCLGPWGPGSWYSTFLVILAAPSGTFQIWFPTHHPAGDTRAWVLEPVNGEAAKDLFLFLAFKV